MNYYNEFDPKAAAWLRDLISRGLIPAGDVDTRSITEVKPHELTRYTQCHFFAGIAGWSLALALAGWPNDRPVWTGSCPCQPFSVAGRGLGTADERHLWPVFAELIGECQPPVVFGEQVASAAGRTWLSGVRADLERMAYAVGAADLCSASVGAPHIRQRLYWVANSGRVRCDTGFAGDRRTEEGEGREPREVPDRCGSLGRLADTECKQCEGRVPGRREELGPCGSWEAGEPAGRGEAGKGADADTPDDCRLGDPLDPRLEGHPRHVADGSEPGRLGTQPGGPAAKAGSDSWDDFVLIPCADGKTRRIEPGLAPLAPRLPGDVALLKGYGNAITPPLAAQFILAYLSVTQSHPIT